MEHLASFDNSRPAFADVWRQNLLAVHPEPRLVKQGDDGIRRRKTAMHALQFLIKYGLAPHATPTPNATVEEYLKANLDSEWIVEAFEQGEFVLPMDDMHPERLQNGLIPDQVTQKFRCLCYDRDDDGLHILLPSGVTPSVFATELKARIDFEGPINVAFADPEEVSKFVENSSVPQFNEIASDRIEIEVTGDDGELDCGDDPQFFQSRVDSLAEAKDVLRWACGNAVALGATDIDFHPMDGNSAVIRLRLNGRLRSRGNLSAEMLARVLSIIKIRCKLNTNQKRLPQDGKFRFRSGSKVAEARVSTLPMQRGDQLESCAIRVLGRVKIPNIQAMGLRPWQLRQLEWTMHRDHGMFLVTGPTGSGKTTTLNCIIREISGEGINVMSAEDPVEIQMPWVKQVQIEPGIDFTFARALKSFLRHDPEVILVGEIRDPESSQICTSAAQTGHFVFATLHTNTALMSVGRLVELGVDRSLVASTLSGVAAQRLVRCLCPSCRERTRPDEEQRTYVERYLARLRKTLAEETSCPDGRELEELAVEWLEKNESYRPGECANCNHTGYSRRKAVLEIYLIGNEAEVMDMIVEGKPVSAIQRYFDASGHLDLAGQSIRLMFSHETTYEEIKKHLPLL
jgi:type II secretory ATPase GspE/PulE/Tfp pilus assembly ATPase PilB-like protein